YFCAISDSSLPFVPSYPTPPKSARDFLFWLQLVPRPKGFSSLPVPTPCPLPRANSLRRGRCAGAGGGKSFFFPKGAYGPLGNPPFLKGRPPSMREVSSQSDDGGSFLNWRILPGLILTPSVSPAA